MIQCRFEDSGEAPLRHVCVDGIVVENGRILFAKRSMKLPKAPGKYCLPGGYLDSDEKLEEGLRREIREETGCVVSTCSLFQIRDTPAKLPDTDRQDVVFVYLCEGVAQDASAHLQEDVSPPEWFAFEDIFALRDQVAFDHWFVVQMYFRLKDNPERYPIFNAFELFNSQYV